MNKELLTEWVSDHRKSMGFMVVENEITQERKILIAVVDGEHMQKDKETIRALGGKLDPKALKNILRAYESPPGG